MFTSILNSATGTLTIVDALICTVTSLVLGFIISMVYMAKGNRSKNLATTLVLLPALVQTIIMLVNGNLGTGIAVMGAFSLVRFRSVAGTSKEICSIFFAMAVGLATGMGYISFAIVITIIVSLVMFLLAKFNFGETKAEERKLKVVVPENLNYTEIFDDIFEKYTNRNTIIKSKTINLGSLYEITYEIELKDKNKEKEMIDEIRCRNGNLTINCARIGGTGEEL
ncbi:MAG: DUF4956 domain-containing protein [Clostridia bacterium]|nr:DUF4956 domain-containing protein [Clostridia bacterium]